jgi:hypothetical protein
MKLPDFVVFSGSNEYRYCLINDKYVTQHKKFNLKNQYTSAWAPLVLPNGGPWGSLKI